MGFASGKIAFLFPGQGSQKTGMLAALREVIPGFERHLQALDQKARALRGSVLELVYRDASPDHDRELTATENAQPALGLVSVALARAAIDLGVAPDFFVGHSYGELAALAACGAFDDETFLRASFERGRLMASAGQRAPGAMIAVRAPAAAVAESIPAGVVIANLNGPKQTVVSGDALAIDALAARLAADGIGHVRLRTACAFHSPLMAPVAAEWASFLDDCAIDGDKARTVIANVSADVYDADARAVRTGLASQLTAPVRFQASIERLYALGVRTFVEVGPGRVLSDLVAQILGTRPHAVVALESEGERADKVLASLAAINAAPAATADDVLALTAASERALASVLAHQREIAALAQHAPAEERAVIAAALGDSSARLLEDFLATQRSILAATFGAAVAPSSAPSMAMPIANPQPATVAPLAVSEPEVPATSALGVERFLRTALTQLTGFSGDTISRATDFERDLALDSITMVELFCQMMDAYPALKGMGTKMRVHKTVGAVVDAVVAVLAPAPSGVRALEPATSPVEAPSEAAPDADESVRGDVFRHVASLAGRDASSLSDALRLETDLGLDVFQREALAEAICARTAALRLGGRELLRERTIGELVSFCDRLVQAARIARAPESSPVRRFVRASVAVSIAAAKTVDSVLLVGPAGPRIRALAGVARARGASVATLLVSESGFFLEGGGRVDLVDEEGLRVLLADVLATTPVALFVAAPPARRTLVDRDLVDGRAFELGATALFTFAKAVMHDGVPLLRRLGVLATSDALWRGALGVARALDREWAIPVRSATLEAETPPVRVFDALSGGESQHDLVLYGQRASRLELAPRSICDALEGERRRLRPEDVVLFVGGGRGITAELAVAVAARHRCVIAAVGRTVMPAEFPHAECADPASLREAVTFALRVEGRQAPSAAAVRARLAEVERTRELWETRRRVEAAGGTFVYRRADVTRAGELAGALAEIRAEVGPFTGLVFGAGVAEDALASQKSLASFRRVLETKAIGAANVRSILDGEPLRFAFFLSSLSAHTGTAGQTDYVAANEIVNALCAEWNRVADFPVRALLYSVWAETGLGRGALKRQMDRLGLDGISNEDGTRAFLAELEDASSDEPWVLLSPESTLAYAAGGPRTESEPYRAVG